MYKLIIVDDEKNAREGIRQLLKWKNFDIEVVDMCCSASEGIQSAMKYKPDIIITDIKMQNVDGLTMIEEILKHIKCEVIIISGYASFEYAQRAINISVAQYLLKPVSRTDLEVAVLKCIMNIQHNTRSNLVEKIGKNEYMLDMLINEDISTEGLIDFKDYYLYIMKSKADFVSDFDEKMKIYQKVNKGIGDVYTLFINRKELMLITADKIKSFDSLKAELSKAFCVGFAYGNHNMKFSEVLFSEVKEIWDGYLEHPFVKAIGEGSLDKEKFKNYLIQDYLYLKDYAKVFAMGLVKASTMDEMKFYHESIKGILDDETAVHVNYLKGFGLSTEEVEEYKSELTTESYTNYMLGIALKGDFKDIAMTIMPGTWSYYYIGKHLYETYKENLKDNFYTTWIEGYASNEFREYTQEWIDYIDDICNDISEVKKERLKDIFIKSSLYEMEFWNMANK